MVRRTMNDEPTLISDCLGGKPDAYRTLVDRHAPAVRAFLLRRLGDPDRAEEAAQEAFVRAYQGLGRLRGGFVSWVLGIAARVALEGRRRPAAAAVGDPESPGARPAPGEEVGAMVVRLPEPYREAVLLRYWAGLSCEQVAEAQGVSVGTATKRLCRAHGMLREALEGRTGTQEVDHELRRVP